VIRIHSTEYFEPKSEDATREIELDDAAVEILRRAKADKPDPIFVLKGGPFRPQTGNFKTYRADASPHRTWTGLIGWLGTKGVNELMPIHVLRKLAGSLVFQAHGIEQARGFLGHGDVSTTSRSYIAKTKRVVVSLTPPSDEVSKAREQMKESTP
jgi:integrase